MKKFYKIYSFFVLIFIAIFNSFIVSADTVEKRSVVGRNIADMELIVKTASNMTETIAIENLSTELILIYLNSDDDQNFVSQFYGAFIKLNNIDQKWYLDRDYLFINIKEQIAYESGYDKALRENYSTIYEKGYEAGYNTGYESGKTSGYIDGYNSGKISGYEMGYEIGYDQGYTSGSQIVSGDYSKYQLIAVGDGSKYYNYLNLETMTFYRNVAQITFSGMENWVIFPTPNLSNTITFRATSQIPDLFQDSDEVTMSSNSFTVIKTSQQNSYDNSAIFNNGTGSKFIFIRINKTTIPNWNDQWTDTQKTNSFKLYLNQSPITVNYKIQNEEIESINQNILENITVYKNGFLNGKRDGIAEGKQLGYKDGYENGYKQALDMSWLKSIFTAFSSFFAIKLFGNITIGIIVGIPLFIGLVFFIFKLIRG